MRTSFVHWLYFRQALASRHPLFFLWVIDNQVVTKGSTLLSDAEVNMLVVLRMNRRFMAYMRKHHPDVSKQHFQMTVLSMADNKDKSDSESD